MMLTHAHTVAVHAKASTHTLHVGRDDEKKCTCKSYSCGQKKKKHIRGSDRAVGRVGGANDASQVDFSFCWNMSKSKEIPMPTLVRIGRRGHKNQTGSQRTSRFDLRLKVRYCAWLINDVSSA